MGGEASSPGRVVTVAGGQVRSPGALPSHHCEMLVLTEPQFPCQ